MLTKRHFCKVSLSLGLVIGLTSSAFAIDQVTVRSLQELKQEIIDRAEKKPQRSPAVKVEGKDIREAVAAIQTMDRDDWAKGFMIPAERHFAEGRKAEAEGKIDAARESYLAAYRLFKIAHYPTNNSPQKQKAYERGVESFLAYAKFLTPKLEVVRIPFEGKEIVGYLRLPKAEGKKVPLVYFATALDSRKEEWAERNEDLLDEGIGIFVTDMPGTGQAPIKVDVNSERMFSAALDYLSQRPEIDAKRLGFYGGSWSGYWAVKMSIVERARLKAVVAQGLPAHHYFHPEWQTIALKTPEYLMDLLPARSMIYGVEGLDAFLAYGPKLSLKTLGVLDKPSTQLLVVNGAKDTQVPIADLHLVAQTVPGAPKEAWINPEGRHMGSDNKIGSEDIKAQIVTPWLVKKLKE